MSLNVFSYVSGPERSLQMVSDCASLLIDSVRAKMGVITKEGLCSIRCSFGCGRSLAFLAKHGGAAISP